jgi:hypothetical protein
MIMKFNCRLCHQTLEIDNSYLGDKVLCPICNNETLVLVQTSADLPRATIATPNGSVVTIQQTSKKYKAGILIGALMTIAGFLFFPICCYTLPNVINIAYITSISAFLFIGGTITLIVSNVLAWWHHG